MFGDLENIFSIRIPLFIVQHQAEENVWHFYKKCQRFNILSRDLTIHFRIRRISLNSKMFCTNIGKEILTAFLWIFKRPAPLM